MLSQPEALDALLATFPSLHRDAKLEERFERAFKLYRHGAVTPVSRCEPWAWDVACERPERTRPGEPLRYTAVIAGGVADWRCDCGDAVWRRAVCKHELAAVLVATYGPAPEPGTVRIVATVDVELEAWLDAIADEAGSEPPDDEQDWAIADWADEDLAEVTLGDVRGHIERRAYGR